MELYNPVDIPKVVEIIFPLLGAFSVRAASRSNNLDQAFIESTNIRWQKKHLQTIRKALCNTDRPALLLSSDPMDNRQQYLIAEKCFDLLGL